MEDYEEQLEIYISPTESNKRFTTLNPNDKNLVIELGLKLLDRGCKSYQILKNDEWNEKLTSLEESKNEEIQKLQTFILNKKEQLQILKNNHKDELDLIKNQVEQKVKCIYESDIENLNEKIKQNIKRVKGLPKIKGVKEILYPGQNKQKRFKKNVNKKIYIPENIKNDLESLIAS